MRGRLALGALGVLVASYGGFLALHDRLDQLPGTLVWGVGGVLAHDFLLVPATLLLLVVAARLLPRTWRAPAGVAFVVIGTLTVVAVPFLGRFGALPDNPTLLDRDYTTGYLVLVGLVLLAVVGGSVGGAVRRRRRPEDLSGALDDTPPR